MNRSNFAVELVTRSAQNLCSKGLWNMEFILVEVETKFYTYKRYKYLN